MSENTMLIVGAGFTGAVLAQLISEKLNEKVLLIDKKNHIAGNSYDEQDSNGITIHKYGSHIFHTSNKKIWDYLNRFASFNTYMHKVYAVIDGILTTIPFNFKTLYDVFPKSLAKRLEEKLLKNYSYNSRVPILEFQKQQDEDLKFLSEYMVLHLQKSFLNKNNINFVEPKGAGWADNLFQVKTLCSAEKILYTDNAYYYYRITNPNSSSVVVNINNPFDRSDEIHEFLDKNNVSDENVLAHLYKRIQLYRYRSRVHYT